jgi:hypothetical protein
MTMLFARLLRIGATALHRFAAFFNERAYLVEHGRKRGVDDLDAVPFRVKFAESRKLIRDEKLNARQRCESSLPVVRCKIDGQLAESPVHEGNSPANANVTAQDVYLAWLKFIEHRPGWERTHALAVLRLSPEDRARLREMAA